MEYTNNGCLNLVIRTYYQNDSLSKDKQNEKYYIKALENDMISMIIKRLPSKYTYLKSIRSCPTIIESKEEYDYSIDVLNRIKILWNIMNNNQHSRMLVGYLK